MKQANKYVRMAAAEANKLLSAGKAVEKRKNPLRKRKPVRKRPSRRNPAFETKPLLNLTLAELRAEYKRASSRKKALEPAIRKTTNQIVAATTGSPMSVEDFRKIRAESDQLHAEDQAIQAYLWKITDRIEKIKEASRKKNTTVIKARKIGRVIIRKRPSAANPYAYQVQYQTPGGSIKPAGAFYANSRLQALKQAEADLKKRGLWHPRTKLITGAVPLTSVAAKHKNTNRKRKQTDRTGAWEKAWGNYIKALQDVDVSPGKAPGRAAAMRLAKAEKRLRELDPGFYKRVILKNPVRTKKASPKARAIREKFTGLKSRKTATLNAPRGTPANLAKLGKLVSITTKQGVIRPARRNPASTVWLCSDTKGRLHFATAGEQLIDGPKRSFGEVYEIEYETAKPHLGHKKPTIFFHKMGEEGGKRPELLADGEGGLKLRGGSYQIASEGIRN